MITTATLFLLMISPDADFAHGKFNMEIVDVEQHLTPEMCLLKAQRINSVPQARQPGDKWATCTPDQPSTEL